MPTARQLNAQHGLRVGTKSVVDGSGTLVDVGDISLLNTTDKTSVVDAVNEVEGSLTNITTADVAEDPGYLYYTDSRSRAAVSVTDAGGDGSLSYDSGTGVFTYTGPSASEVRAHFSGGTGVSITDGTIAIGQSVGTTDNVTFANTTLTGVLYGPSQFVIDPAAQGDITGEVIVLGDLRVEGTTTTINSTTVEVEDKTVLLAKSATVPTDANGAGIEVAGSGANLLYSFTTDSWNPNKSLKGIDGDASSPAYSFATDPGLGLYRSADNQLSLATNGLERFRVSDTTATLVGSVDLTLNRGTYGGTITTGSLTANRTYTLPNVSGTLVTTGDTGTVTSAMIENGTIVDADVSPTAEIAVSKLADGSARQLIQTNAAGTGVEWTSNIDIPGTLDVTGATTFDSIAQHPLGTAGAPTITFTGDTNTGIYSPGADQLAISTNGTGRLFIDANGKVFVNSTTSSRLEITNSSGTGGGGENLHSYTANYYIWGLRNEINDLAIESAFGGNIIFRAENDGVSSSPGSATERLRITSTGALNFVGAGTAGSTQAVSFNGSAPVNSLVIDSSGRVGLGTSSPNSLPCLIPKPGMNTAKPALT